MDDDRWMGWEGGVGSSHHNTICIPSHPPTQCQLGGRDGGGADAGADAGGAGGRRGVGVLRQHRAGPSVLSVLGSTTRHVVIAPSCPYSYTHHTQEDYPLERPAAIRAHLATAAPAGTNFIYCWDINGHDFFGQWEHHHGRVQRVFVDMFDGRTVEMEGVARPPPTVRGGWLWL